jgi:DNA-binding MarR family transcriptional regulator
MQDPIKIRLRGAVAEVTIDGSDSFARFRSVRISSLTDRAWIEEVLPLVESGERVLVSFERASPLARREMRRQRVSWQGDDGEMRLDAPPIYVERPGRGKELRRKTRAKQFELIHFAKRGSRVTRWLVNHPNDSTTVSALANELALTESTVSRSLAVLRTIGFLETATDENDRRSKRVRLTDGGRLLDLWSDHWRNKKLKTVNLDIGTSNIAESLEQVRLSASTTDGSLDWMLGGLSGAAAIVPAVEPADLFVWIRADQLDPWIKALVAVEVPRVRANVRLALADDPWIFALANLRSPRVNRYGGVIQQIEKKRGDKYQGVRRALAGADVPVADPAQIYLDCGREGERALDAADAVKQAMKL